MEQSFISFGKFKIEDKLVLEMYVKKIVDKFKDIGVDDEFVAKYDLIEKEKYDVFHVQITNANIPINIDFLGYTEEVKVNSSFGLYIGLLGPVIIVRFEGFEGDENNKDKDLQSVKVQAQIIAKICDIILELLDKFNTDITYPNGKTIMRNFDTWDTRKLKCKRW